MSVRVTRAAKRVALSGSASGAPLRPPALLCLALLAACPAVKKPTGTPPERFCPGADGCLQGADGTLEVGLAAAKVTPRAWEKPRPDYLAASDACPETASRGTDGRLHCGALIANAFRDCGLDTLCPGDVGYPGPDTGERDGHPDWFFDCGRDQRCPGEPGYPGPDADGSEGDDKFEGYWLAGFNNNIPMVDVHDDQWARAVVLKNGDVALAVVSVDTVGLFRDDVQRIRDRVAKKVAAPGLDYVLVTSTHSHEAPDTLGQFGPAEGELPSARGVDDAWLSEVLIENAAQAVADAFSSRRPARLYAAQVKLGATTRELISDTRSPFVSDDAVTVLEFVEKKSGDPLGTLVSWGNHPETVGGRNNSLSSDFAFALREGMEHGVSQSDGSLLAPGAGGTCVFVNGAVGGMMTSLYARTTAPDGTVPRDESFAKAKAVGEKVALAALAGLADAKELPAPPLAFGAQTVSLPLENEVFQLLFTGTTLFKRRLTGFDPVKPISAANMPQVLTEIAKLQIGGVRLLAVPGELLPELAVGYDPAFAFGFPQLDPQNPNPPDLSRAPPPPYLKDLMHGELNCVVGLANDELGYIIPAYDFQLSATRPWVDQAPGDHYEETNSIGPSIAPRLLEAYAPLLAWEPNP